MTVVRIPVAVIESMVIHARREKPRECCGLLIGSPSQVDRLFEARNTRVGTIRYEVDPADHFEAIRLARHSGRAICGAYHSHPRGPAEPSETDLAEAHDATLLYVIVSLLTEPPVVRGFRLEDGNFSRVELVPIP